jgi:hypothetical protein
MALHQYGNILNTFKINRLCEINLPNGSCHVSRIDRLYFCISQRDLIKLGDAVVCSVEAANTATLVSWAQTRIGGRT